MKEGYNLELINKKFDVLEEKVGDLRGRVDDLSKINDVLIELKHLSEQQGKMIERLFETQIEQSNTLVDISTTTNTLGYRVSSTEDVMEDINERLCKEKERGVIYMSEVAKSGLFVILGAVLAAIIALII